MFLPVERSMTVSAPCRVAHVIFSTSSSMEEATAELPMLALIFTRKRRPMIIGSVSGWLTSATRWRAGELNLGRDLAPARVVHLGDAAAGPRPIRSAHTREPHAAE